MLLFQPRSMSYGSNQLIEYSLLNENDWLIVVSEQSVIDGHGIHNGFVVVSHVTHSLQQYLQRVPLFYVGDYQQGQCYVVDITLVIDHVMRESCVHFRQIMGSIPVLDSRLVSRGLQLITWNRQHQFCGQCGEKNTYCVQEQSLNCEACGLSNYPRISPCMMCLVTKGDYCLLAHHQRHKEGMYSTLAGFVEAGESVEQTVHREVMEEVGLHVDSLSYFTTQAWPFPHQLMIGYFAEYASGDICIDDNEIADAQWFHYTALPEIPPANTLSGMMIDAFIQQRRQQSR